MGTKGKAKKVGAARKKVNEIFQKVNEIFQKVNEFFQKVDAILEKVGAILIIIHDTYRKVGVPLFYMSHFCTRRPLCAGR